MSFAKSSSLSLLLLSTNHMQRTRRKMKPNTEPRVAPTITPALLAKDRNQGMHASSNAHFSDCTQSYLVFCCFSFTFWLQMWNMILWHTSDDVQLDVAALGSSWVAGCAHICSSHAVAQVAEFQTSCFLICNMRRNVSDHVATASDINHPFIQCKSWFLITKQRNSIRPVFKVHI